MAEKSALADYLIKTTGLTLSPEKRKVTAMTEGFEFLGFRFSVHWDKRYGYGPRVEIPKAKAANLRHKVKQLTQRDSIRQSWRKAPEGECHHQRMGELLSVLCRCRPRIRRSRLACVCTAGYVRNVQRQHRANCGAQNSQADAGRRGGSGGRDPLSNTCSAGHLSSDIVSRGWIRLTLPCLLGSQMRNERRTSGSARGDARPAAARR